MPSLRYVVVVAALVAVTRAAAAGTEQAGGLLSRLPGGQTAGGLLASTSDGVARYLAQDGPIQPALTAIGSLPVRATEQLNRGISRISAGFGNQAQRLSQSAGQGGQIRMPGLDAAESHMPQSFAKMGQSMHNMIKQKNQFIMGQAEQGIQAGNRLGQMMRSGAQQMAARSSGMGHSMGDSMSSMMEGPKSMLNSAQEFMVKSASTMQEHAKEHLSSAMSHMGSMQGMGKGMMDQAQSISQTLQSGVHGVMGQLQQTGQQMMSQLQKNRMKNMNSMSGVMDSMQGSMGMMGSHMQSHMDGMMEHASNTAQQLTGSLKKAAELPMKVLSSLQEGLGSMMSMKGGSMQQGGRY